MKKKRTEFNKLDEDIYGPKFWTKTKLITISFVILFFSFAANFPLESLLNKWVNQAIMKIDSCPMSYENAHFSFFPPKAIITNLTIQGLCFGKINNQLKLKTISIHVKPPSLFPPSLNLQSQIKEDKTVINLYSQHSFYFNSFEIKDSKIDLKILAPLSLENKSLFDGILEASLNLNFTHNGIENSNIRLTSGTFSLNAQNVNGFELPYSNFRHLDIKIHTKVLNDWIVDFIELGAPDSHIAFQMSGHLQTNPSLFGNSQLTLKGLSQLDKTALNNYPFLNLFLPDKVEDGHYKLTISGPLNHLSLHQNK